MHFRVERDPDQAQLTPAAGETIAAISTPAGEGAIALVRISGANAIDVADAIFQGAERPSEFRSHIQHYGEIRNGSDLIDRVMLSVHRAPASYTGEDLVEITCHGGVLVTARVLESCLGAGAQAAQPGEFTERAFLNGKMDLTQAEAVIDLIRAKTDLALRSATEQLEGRLGNRIRVIRDELVSVLAHIEAAIDFPEEGISPDDSRTLGSRLVTIRDQISELLNTATQGRILREGVRVVIYGATNAGKSSLLNRLLGHERVIVSDTHGTTRDTIEEAVNLGGFPIRLIDTAGLRSAADEIEREGIARTEKSLRQADLRLLVVDASAPKSASLNLDDARTKELLVLNKIDLPQHPDWAGTVGLRISCLTEEGLPNLERAILNRITSGNLQADNSIAINTRHRDCLRRAFDACEHALNSLGQGIAPEYIAVDLNSALRAVGEIIGTVDVEQVLDSVFGQFCIGK
jgi:tRNA modification GTPase